MGARLAWGLISGHGGVESGLSVIPPGSVSAFVREIKMGYLTAMRCDDGHRVRMAYAEDIKYGLDVQEEDISE